MSITESAVSSAPTSKRAWVVVGLLWVCGMLNYADRQALAAVQGPLVVEFGLNDEQWGLIGSAFMWVYAITAPFAGFVVDHARRRWVVVVGLGFWSLICAATGNAWGFTSLLVLRGLEGLGETFYFPASMSLLADHHGPRTRSRAMSLHQTSVYAGTSIGLLLGAWMADQFGWRTGFWLLGGLGILYAIYLATQLDEPKRALAEHSSRTWELEEAAPFRWSTGLKELLSNPAALALLLAFGAANFVASAMLWWLPAYVKRKFGLDLTGAALVAALFWPPANCVGALLGGPLADWACQRRPGGRARVQMLGLLIGAPCIYFAGTTDSSALLIAALLGIGLGKGLYDANIFAAAFDVVRPQVRGTAAGLMNTVGWGFGAFAPWMMGKATAQFGLGASIAMTSVLYLGASILAWLAAILTARSAAKPLAV